MAGVRSSDDGVDPAAATVRPSTGQVATLPADADGRLTADEALTVASDFEQRYELGDELARGGLARIRDAYDRVLHRRVAVKQLLTRHGDADVRFLREARITGRLAHPNIVPIYDLGLDADGAPFYAMKWVRGRSLHDLIEDRPTLDERLALLPHVQAIVDAVAYAHSVGVLHRDLKPANVLVGDFGETIVIDWGLAHELGTDELRHEHPAAAPADPRLTTAGSVIGTPAYMPPEQARGERVDARADVYALGATLYHVIAGAFPYQAREDAATVAEPAWARVLTEPPTPLAERCPEAPRDLCAIVEQAMARAPADRYPTASALGAALAGFLAHHPSYRLAEAAVARSDELLARLAAVSPDDAAAVAGVYRDADVVLFGFEQALQGWAENPVAVAGLARLRARLFEFECAVGNLAAAAALAAALPPDPARARRLAALEADRARRDAEAAAFVRDQDRSIGGRERVILMAVVGAILFLYLGDALVRGRPLHSAGATEAALVRALLVAVPALALMWLWRRRLFANEFSRRTGRTVAAIIVTTIAHRIVAIPIDEPAARVFLVDMFVIMAAMLAFGGTLGRALAALALVGASLCAAFPEGSVLIYNGTLLTIATILGLAWSRSSRARR